MFSNNPKLSLQKMLVFGALGLYVYKHMSLKASGELGNSEPDLLLKLDKNKVFDFAQKKLNMNHDQRNLLENIYTHLAKEPDDEETT